MDECNLDWKKVFKEILGGKSQSPQDSVSSEECKKRPYSNVISSSEVKESKECDSSRSSKVKSSNNELHEKRVNYYASYKTIPQETSISKGTPAKRFTSRSYLEQTNNSPNFCGNDKIPEWNKVFKRILGNNSARDAQERKDIEYPLKKPDALQKQNEPVNRKCYRKKKISDSVFKTKIDEEEKKVREMFALSRLFKHECPFNSLNDLAGSGVDIFKCDKTLISPFSPSCEKKNESQSDLDDDSCDQYSELSVPVTGLIANIKPLTRDVVRDSPCVPLTEIWDDDFLF